EEEAVGKFAAELIISPEQKKSSEETWARLVDGSGGTRRTTENITRDGRLRIIDWYNAPLRDENGVIHGVASLCHDITENVTAQNALKASEEQFRGLYENVDIGLYRSTPQGVVLMANKTLVHMLGYGSFEEIAMMNLETDGYDTPADRNTFKALMERDGVVTGFEVRLRRKDGSLIYARENSKAIRDEGGTVLFYDGSIENISDRKKAEDHVQKLLKAVEQSPVSIVITNLLGQIEYVNPKFTEVTGYSFEEAFNQNPRILKSGLLPGEAYKEMWETITAGNIWRGELPNKKKNGDIYWELVSISPLKNDHGEITHFIAVKEDITERKQLIHELIQAKDRAEEMNKIKSNFFSNMSHELRTPLIGILGYSEILQDSLSSSSEYHEMASIINSAGRRLLETLNMILSISKLESATLEANRKPQNICEIIKEVYNLYLQAASNKGLMLNMNFDQDEIYCNIDGKLFFEVINNLVNNAIKYTDFGAIWLGVEVNDGTVTIDVGDTGIGIPEDKQPIIWEAFRQVSEGFGRSFEGTGLGLTITKKYVELMGGEIALNSKVSVGSVFHVSFPIIDKTTGHKIGSVKHAEPKPPIQVENRPATAKVHLLIVEDDEVVISLIVAMLAGEYYVECCTTAADALQKVQERVYDGILMDINLRKGMDGVQLTQLIRQMPAYRHTPIIACTAYAMDQDKEDFLTQGMSHYLSKPFGRKELLDLLQEVFHK
ncbi:MAG: PAS domain S-box protein, partial [Ignavibacteria bacterium]|nr:PAS domain S-box protein [Ignavibacteria bacterium]